MSVKVQSRSRNIETLKKIEALGTSYEVAKISSQECLILWALYTTKIQATWTWNRMPKLQVELPIGYTHCHKLMCKELASS